MSKRFDTSGMYPGKRNPGGSPTTGRTNNTPQGKAGETPVQVPVRPGTVQNRGDRARESYAPPTRTRPTTKPNTTPAQTPASPKPAQTPQPKPAPTPEEVRRNNLNDMNEILGVNSYTGEAEDIAKEEWRRSGVQNAEEYRRVSDYHWRSGVGGVMDTARNAVNDTYYRLQNGRAEQLAEDAVMREMNLHGGDYNELYAKYLKQYREQEKGYQPTKAVDWGEKYNAETARMAEEAGFNDYVRRDGQLYRAIGGMLPALALSAVGNVGSGVMMAKGAYAAAKGAAKIGKVLSASMTFSSASGAAFDNEIAKGTDPETAMKIATLAGVVELGTEAITSGMGRLCGKRLGYGGAAADEMMKRLAARVSSDSAVQNALLYLGGVLGEGFEEFLSEWGNYAANRALSSSDTRTAREVWGDSKESFWDGVFVAGLLNATTLLQSGESPQDAIKQGVDEAVQNPDGVQQTGTGKRTGLKPGEIAGKISDSLRNKLPQRALLQLNETLEQSDAGRRFAEELSGMDADAAAQLTEAVTDAVSDAVKRGEEYSSREDFLTDGSVGRMTEAVLDETLKSLGAADADTAPKGRVTTDPRVAALADMAVDALDERLQTDTALRDAIERGRQTDGQNRVTDVVDGIEDSQHTDTEAASSLPDMDTLYKDYLEQIKKADELGMRDDNGLSYQLSRQSPNTPNLNNGANGETQMRFQEKAQEPTANLPKSASDGKRPNTDAGVENATQEFVDGPFTETGELKPNIEYCAGEFGYVYKTDALGRICSFMANALQLTTRNKRLRNERNTPGKLKYDDAGHLIGDRFGGANTIANLVSQLRNVNRGEYRVMEDRLAREIRKGKNIAMEGMVIYNKDSLRPEGILIETLIDGAKTSYSFSNTH